jgi:predicted RNA binding protein YcfA (HicA-like mRNA interferase family)/predicted RNase H-like HicB family nuclease
MTRAVHVPYTVEQDEDGIWCAHAQLRPGRGANGEGETADAAVADLREALKAMIAEFGAPDEITVIGGRGLMPPVPSVRGERVVRALEKAGFAVAHCRKPSNYASPRRARNYGTVHHGRDVAKGTLRGILSDASMMIEELQGLL